MPASVILIVDDEPIIVNTLVLVLNRSPQEFFAIGATNIADAMAIVHGIRPDLVILDTMMPGVQGLQHAVEMRENCGCKVLMMSGHTGTGALIDEWNRAGNEPFDIVAKPMHPTALISKIREMLQTDVRTLEWRNPLSFHVQ
jgi:DNA-binding response OmpR family regulator